MTTINDNKPILLVEDDIIDIKTVQRAFKDLRISNPIDLANNGEEAVEYLKNGSSLPCLILLDINMPKMNGIEFLEFVKNDDEFKKIPVVVVTTSKEQHDRLASYNLSAAGYLVKPIDYQNFLEAMRVVGMYWKLCLPS